MIFSRTVKPGHRSPRRFGWLAPLMILSLLGGCGEAPEKKSASDRKPAPAINLEVVPWSEPDAELFEDRNLAAWADALEQSAGYYTKRRADAVYRFGRYRTTAAAMATATRDLARVARGGDGQKLKDHLKKEYLLLRSIGRDGRGEVLVTAYYEPLLNGAREPSETHAHPLYRRPDDMLVADLGAWFSDLKGKRLVARLVDNRLKPYFNRAEIDQAGSLAGRDLELVWTDDPVAVFFLHIQGSGRVRLDNGEMMRVGYDGANGHPYRSIGKLLIDEGAIPRKEMTAPRLKQWLRSNPGERERVFNHNPSYVFFRELKGSAVGNIAVPLTPGRSMATDHRLFPKGAPAILATTLPNFDEDGKTVRNWRPDIRFMVNQDTGGAIRGPGRVDLFMGFGDEAEQTAGIMKQTDSRLWFIAPKSAELVDKPEKKSWWAGLLSLFE